MEQTLEQVSSNDQQHGSQRRKISEVSHALHQDYLEGGRGSCNIFKDGDAAQLFSAPALVGSFVGIATGGRIMSSSSSKDIHKQGNARELHLGHKSNVSAHQGLSDNKDVNFEKESGSDSGESGSNGWVDDHGGEAGVDGDTKSLLLQKWDQEDLVLVEGALVQMLQKKSTSSSSKRLNQDGEGEGLKSESGVLLEQTGGSEILDSQWDFELLSRLLHQVQALRVEKSEHRQRQKATESRSTYDSSSSWDVTRKSGDKQKVKLRKYEMKRMVEAAAQAAEAASEAAKAAVESVAKHEDMIEVLLQMLGSKSRFPHQQKATKRDDELSDTESEEEKISKKIVRQNQITHWTLGFMLVTSFIWRYIVVKVAKRVKNKVSDPLGYIGGIVTDGFKGPGKDSNDDKIDTNRKPPLIPPVKLPSLLHGKTDKEGGVDPSPQGAS